MIIISQTLTFFERETIFHPECMVCFFHIFCVRAFNIIRRDINLITKLHVISATCIPNGKRKKNVYIENSVREKYPGERLC